MGKGKPVLLIQELPGIGIETLALAKQFVNNGFKVYLPHLFGPIGKTSLLGNTARVFCMRKEFKIFEKQQASPIISWLRALCQQISTENNDAKVGVIGMCLTGNFAISLIADNNVNAAVASQPSLPVGAQKELHMSSDDIAEIKQAIDNSSPILAYRFENDQICQNAKFTRLQQTFNDDRKRIKLVTLPGDGHAVLTIDFVDEAGHPTRAALDEILSYFNTALAR